MEYLKTFIRRNTPCNMVIALAIMAVHGLSPRPQSNEDIITFSSIENIIVEHFKNIDNCGMLLEEYSKILFEKILEVPGSYSYKSGEYNRQHMISKHNTNYAHVCNYNLGNSESISIIAILQILYVFSDEQLAKIILKAYIKNGHKESGNNDTTSKNENSTEEKNDDEIVVGVVDKIICINNYSTFKENKMTKNLMNDIYEILLPFSISKQSQRPLTRSELILKNLRRFFSFGCYRQNSRVHNQSQ